MLRSNRVLIKANNIDRDIDNHTSDLSKNLRDQKFYTLLLWLFLLTMKQRKCINISFLAYLSVSKDQGGYVFWVWFVHIILNQKKLTGLTVGVREGQNMAQNCPHIAPYCSVFWPSLTPTVNPVKSLLFKMVCTCVPHIILHVLSSTSTSGG